MTKKRASRFHKASNGGCAHYIAPGGYIEPEVAEQIKNDPSVMAGEDGMWPGHSQTWRIAP